MTQIKARIIDSVPTPQELQDLLSVHKWFVKLAVDVRLRRVAGGGEWHADSERILLELGSQQEDIWGGDWIPEQRAVEFNSLINISAERGNRSMEITDPDTRQLFEDIVRQVFDAS